MDLLTAAKEGNIERVQELINEGVDLNMETDNGPTALMLAARYNNTEMVKILLKAGADLNIQQRKSGWTALMFAENNIEIIKLLIQARAKLDLYTVKGFTALILAIIHNKVETVKLLIQAGAKLDLYTVKGFTALIAAIIHNKIEIVRIILEAGADSNQKNLNKHLTPLMYASDRNNVEIVNLLIQAGAEINSQNDDGWTALMFSVAGEKSGKIKTVRFLLEAGANPNIQNFKRGTVLMIASHNFDEDNSKEIINLLIEYGANPLIKGQDKDALDYCLNEKCKQIVGRAIWEHLYRRDLDTAQRYAKSTGLDRDSWSIILLNKRQQQLCQNLSSSKNREVLFAFAMEFGMPVKENMTKAQLCGIVSRYLVYGKNSTNKPEQELNKFEENIRLFALKSGLDPTKSIKELLKDLTEMSK